jgi:hypothetical protein
MTTAIQRSTAVKPRTTGAAPGTLKGTLRVAVVNKGSKSERRSLVMKQGGRTVVIQRQGSFGLDPKDRSLNGKSVVLKGRFISERLFRFTSVAVAQPKS